MCEGRGSNHTPVRKSFEHDQAEASADIIVHTAPSIQDDSPNQKKTKNWQRRLQPTAERFKSAQKEDTQQRHVKHESTRRFKRKTFGKDDTEPLADYTSELKIYPKERPQIKRKNVLTETSQDGRAV